MTDPPAFRTPYAACDAFTENVSRALRCVTNAHLDASRRIAANGVPIPLSLNRDQPTRLRAPVPLALRVRVLCRVEQHDDSGWHARTSAYYYTLLDERREILMYHWHPEQTPAVTFPHLHLEAGAGVRRDELTRAHLPTGWVPLEAVLQLTIADFGAEPLRDDWRDILTRTESAATATRATE